METIPEHCLIGSAQLCSILAPQGTFLFSGHSVVNFITCSQNITDKLQHLFTLMFAQMQAEIRDVTFYFKKSIPQLKDSGLEDVIVGGEGLSVHLWCFSIGVSLVTMW